MVNVTNRPYVAVRLIPIKLFFRHILYLLGFQLRRNQIVTVSFVIRANELFFLYQFPGNLPVELTEIFRKPLAENLKAAMSTPKIQNSESAIANRLALHVGSDVTLSPPQKLSPNSIRPKNNFKLSPLTFPDPEPAVDDEPRRR
jgi:hypothetical protein